MRNVLVDKYGPVLGKVRLKKAVMDLTGEGIPPELLTLDLDNPVAPTPVKPPKGETVVGLEVVAPTAPVAGVRPMRRKTRVKPPQSKDAGRTQPWGAKKPPVPAPETPVGAPEPATPIPTPEALTKVSEKLKSAEGELFTEERMNPANIGVKEGFQYKNTEVSDAVNQVSGKLKGVEVYDQSTGPLTVWEAADGKRYVMNGHHRLELAKRTNTESVAVNVFREIDGVTPEKARALGVLQNLRDGTGTAIDAARVLQDLGKSANDLGKMGINLKQGVGRDAVKLMSLDPATLDYVIARNIPEAVAAEVAAADLTPVQRTAILRRIADKDIRTRTESQLLVESIKNQPMVTRDDGSGNLFGDIEMDFPFEEHAKITAAVMEQLQRVCSVTQASR